MAAPSARVTARFVPTLTQAVDPARVQAAQQGAAPAQSTPVPAPLSAPQAADAQAPAPIDAWEANPEAQAQAIWQHLQPRIDAALAQSAERLLQRLQAVELSLWAEQTRADLQALTQQAVQQALAGSGVQPSARP